MHSAIDAAAFAVVHDQVEREIFDEEVGVVAQALLVERVQHRVAGAVGGGAGALRGGAFAHVLGHAAERALVDLAFVGAAERQAGMLELVDRGRRFAAQIFDRVLVAEPVGALDGVVHVPGPVVRTHVAEAGGDAALRRDGVAAGREDLGDAGGLQAFFGRAHGGAQARAAGADDDDVIDMIDDLVGGTHGASGSEGDAGEGEQGERPGADMEEEADEMPRHAAAFVALDNRR